MALHPQQEHVSSVCVPHASPASSPLALHVGTPGFRRQLNTRTVQQVVSAGIAKTFKCCDSLKGRMHRGGWL